MDDKTKWLMPKRGFIRDWVDLYTPLGESPPEAHLGTALAVASAAVGWRMWMSWGELNEPVTLTVVLEGQSAVARKTTTSAAADRIVRLACAGIEDAPGLSVRKLGHTSDRGIMEMVGTTDQMVRDKWEKEPPPGHLWVWDEIGGILGNPGEQKGEGWMGRLRAMLMTMTAGSHGGIQTGSATILPSRCSVSILGTMTRAEITQRMSMGLIEDGFLGRIVLCPVGDRHQYLALPVLPDSAQLRKRDELVKWVRYIAGSKDCIGPLNLVIDDRGRQLRTEWYESRARELDKAGKIGGDVASGRVTLFGRLQALALKVAAVGGAANLEPGQPFSECVVGEDEVAWGIGFAEFVLGEFTELMESGMGTPSDRYARRVLEHLARAGTLSRKELQEEVKADGLSRSTRWQVIEGMHEDGSLVIEKEQTGGRARMVVRLG